MREMLLMGASKQRLCQECGRVIQPSEDAIDVMQKCLGSGKLLYRLCQPCAERLLDELAERYAGKAVNRW